MNKFASALLVAALGLGTTLSAQEAPPRPALPGGAGVGDLLVAPTRLIFEGNKRVAEVSLVNIGTAPATYRISLTHMRMTETGELKEIVAPEAADMVAESIVRYSPRQVRLEPNVAQTIRLQVRKPADLRAGEYRSHLLFRAVPEPEAPAAVEAAPATPPEGLTIRLRPIFGVSIPLIVRHQTTGATGTIEDIKLLPPAAEGAPWRLSMKLTRSGDESLHGSVRINVGQGETGKIVGMLNGVAVYTPLTHRVIEIGLRSEEVIDFTKSRFTVSYRETEEQGGNLIAQSEWGGS